jgi:hypothetical protein
MEGAVRGEGRVKGVEEEFGFLCWQLGGWLKGWWC